MKSICALAALAVACAPAAVEAAALKAHAPYAAVRKELIRQGWTPIAAPPHAAEGLGGNTSTEALMFVQAGYKEIESCTGTGLDYCTFNFRRKGKCLKIVTQGELRPEYKSPQVHHWSNDCGFED